MVVRKPGLTAARELLTRHSEITITKVLMVLQSGTGGGCGLNKQRETSKDVNIT